MYSRKYRIEKIEEMNAHNSIYNGVKGRVCYPAYLKAGERGWFLYERDEDWIEPVHRIHTSIIKSVEYTGTQIFVVTQNTKFTFTLIEENL